MQLNFNSSLLMDVDEAPIIAAELHDKKMLVLGQINGNVYAYDVAKLFDETSNDDEKVFLKYQYLEENKETHLTSLNVFENSDKMFINAGYDKGFSKIFSI